jgi:integrase
LPQVHLVRRGRTFYFRAGVPLAVRKIVRLREIKISLRTSDPMSARMRARLMSNGLEGLWQGIRSMSSPLPETFQVQLKDYFQGLLNKSLETAYLLPTDDAADLPSEIASMEADLHKLKQALGLQEFDQGVRLDAVQLLANSNPPGLKPSLDAIRQACSDVQRARIENRRILIARLNGDFANILPNDPLFAGMNATEMPPLPGEAVAQKPTQSTLSECAEIFTKFKSNDWVKKTAGDTQRTLNLAVAVIGAKKPIRSVDADDVKKMRDALGKLPANYMKASSNAALSVTDALAGNLPGPKLSVKTQEKYLFMFKGMLKWCRDENYIDIIPGVGVKVAGAGKLDPADQRHPYSTDQLKKIFNSPLFTGHKDESSRHKPGPTITRDGKYWVPLIALYTGMRMSEIVQLSRTDLKLENGIFYFDVAKGDDKTLKTLGSKRRIPVHQKLIEFGLLVFVAELEGSGRIFEDVKKGSDGYYSQILSKWWGRYAARVGFKTPKTAFHSFRHNFLDGLRAADLPQYVNEALMGHSTSSVHSKYGSGPSLSQLKQAIDKVSYAVEFSCYKQV